MALADSTFLIRLSAFAERLGWCLLVRRGFIVNHHS